MHSPRHPPTAERCCLRRQPDGEGDVSAVEVRLAVPELQAGQELTIQYVGSGAPLTSFLNFGFVPQQQ